MNHALSQQKGMTGLGWLTVLALIGFFALLTLKIVPIYLEYYSVKSTLKSLETEPLVTKKSPAEIKKLLKKRLNINYVSGLPKDAFKIKKSSGVLKVNLDYQVRKNLFGNIDLLVSFKDDIELVSH